MLNGWKGCNYPANVTEPKEDMKWQPQRHTGNSMP